MSLRRSLTLVACLVGLSACNQAAPETADPPRAGASDVVPLSLSCVGEGSPTLLFESGLGEDAAMWGPFVERFPAHRVCTSSRAGLGDSPPLGEAAPDPSPGRAAETLHETLEQSGETGPFVVIGFSYGGLVAQAFAAHYIDEVAGLVLIDSAHPGEFTRPEWQDLGIDWSEAGRDIDQDAVAGEIAGLDLGDRPVGVLTQDQLPPQLDASWLEFHREFAAYSEASVHLRALGSGHAIFVDRPELVAQLIDEVAAAAGNGTPLAPCDDRFAAAKGRCLSSPRVVSLPGG